MNVLDLQVKVWRRDLHKWDPEVAEDEEVIEVGLQCIVWLYLLHELHCPFLALRTLQGMLRPHSRSMVHTDRANTMAGRDSRVLMNNNA